MFAQLQLLDKLKGNGRDGTDFPIRPATEYEQAVSVLVCFDILVGFLRKSDTTARHFKLRSTTIEDTHHIGVFLTSHCAQLLLEGIKSLHWPLCEITGGLCKAFHDAMARIVNEHHSLLAFFSVVSDLEVTLVYQLGERLEVYILLGLDLLFFHSNVE